MAKPNEARQKCDVNEWEYLGETRIGTTAVAENIIIRRECHRSVVEAVVYGYQKGLHTVRRGVESVMQLNGIPAVHTVADKVLQIILVEDEPTTAKRWQLQSRTGWRHLLTVQFNSLRITLLVVAGNGAVLISSWVGARYRLRRRRWGRWWNERLPISQKVPHGNADQ